MSNGSGIHPGLGEHTLWHIARTGGIVLPRNVLPVQVLAVLAIKRAAASLLAKPSLPHRPRSAATTSRRDSIALRQQARTHGSEAARMDLALTCPTCSWIFVTE